MLGGEGYPWSFNFISSQPIGETEFELEYAISYLLNNKHLNLFQHKFDFIKVKFDKTTGNFDIR